MACSPFFWPGPCRAHAAPQAALPAGRGVASAAQPLLAARPQCRGRARLAPPGFANHSLTTRSRPLCITLFWPPHGPLQRGGSPAAGFWQPPRRPQTQNGRSMAAAQGALLLRSLLQQAHAAGHATASTALASDLVWSCLAACPVPHFWALSGACPCTLHAVPICSLWWRPSRGCRHALMAPFQPSIFSAGLACWLCAPQPPGAAAALAFQRVPHPVPYAVWPARRARSRSGPVALPWPWLPFSRIQIASTAPSSSHSPCALLPLSFAVLWTLLWCYHGLPPYARQGCRSEGSTPWGLPGRARPPHTLPLPTKRPRHWRLYSGRRSRARTPLWPGQPIVDAQ
jgi:hypothetical protein